MKKIFIIIRRVVYLLLGSLNNLFSPHSPGVFVLCYHSLANDSWEHSVSPEEFKKQIVYLTSHFNFATLSDLYLYLNKKKKFVKPAVILNFDDGYRSILLAREFLAKLGIKPTLFVLSNKTDVDRKQLGSDKQLLADVEIKQLQKDGWEIGSHSATHTNMLGLDDKEIAEQVVDSKFSLEKELKTKIYYFAYPNGNYNSEILNCVKKAGYRLGLTMDDDCITNSVNPLQIPRIGVNGTHSFAEFKTLFNPLNIKVRKLIKSVLYEKN